MRRSFSYPRHLFRDLTHFISTNFKVHQSTAGSIADREDKLLVGITYCCAVKEIFG